MNPLLEPLTLEDGVPWHVIRDCQENIDALRPDLLAAVERMLEDDVEEDQAQEVEDRGFLAMHLLAEVRETRLFPLLTRTLVRADATELVAAAIGTTLPKLLISCYDGDADALFAVLRSPEVDEVIRDDLFGALACLTWRGRIDAAATRDFLVQFDEHPPVDDDDPSWLGWMTAIGLLGWTDLEPRVERAFTRRSILAFADTFAAFQAALRQSAAADPGDSERFEAEGLDFLDELQIELASLDDTDDEAYEDDLIDLLAANDDADPLEDGTAAPLRGSGLPGAMPAINPMRDVGRNDPCPCGSGKKYKRCCGATA